MTPAPMAHIAVEGDLDQAVLTKLLGSIGVDVLHTYGRQGKQHLKKRVEAYNHAAQHARWVLLVDLDNDAECPPPFVSAWLPKRHPNLQLRVAVRAVEAWLLADRAEMARFLRVSRDKIPFRPEEESNPKHTLIGLARRSRSKEIRGDMVPRPGSSASQGRLYTGRLIEFTLTRWDPARAAKHAPSLERSLNSLSQWRNASVNQREPAPRNPDRGTFFVDTPRDILAPEKAGVLFTG